MSDATTEGSTMYRVTVTGYQDDLPVGDFFYVQANDESHARTEAVDAAKDCGWVDPIAEWVASA